MGISATRDPTGEEYAEFQRKRYPELAYDQFRDRVERALGERELGAEFKLEPDLLRQALGWWVSSAPELLYGYGAAAWEATAKRWAVR
jgi:hypothetical protein